MAQNIELLVSTPDDQIVLRATFPNVSPGELFNHWVEPDLLSKWWPQ